MSTVHSTDNVRSDTLPNGITVITEQMTHVRSVSVGIWVTAGSRNETPQQNGISHFIEHMLFKGTQNRSAEDIARQVDSMGAHLDAFTSKELVCFNAKMLDDHLSQAFDVLSDLVLRPLFLDEDIEKEKGVVLEELKMEVDNPEYLVHDIFSSSIWKNHSLGRPILGTKETIQGFTPDMLRDYFRRMYAPGSTVITAAGNLSHDVFVKMVADQFGGLQPYEAIDPYVAPKAHAKLIFKNKRSLEQVHLCLGVPCHPLPHTMRFPSYVLNTVLGGGISSRLFQNIREKRGLAYSVGSEQFLYRDSGLFSIYAGTSLASVPELLRLVLVEFRDLKDNLVTDEELRRAKDNLKGSLMLGLESTGSRMSHLARQFIYFRRFSTMDEITEAIEKVQAEDLRTLANEYFQTEKIAMTVLGRLNGFKMEREQLAC
ncbi:MAG TPA: pitrilysin family protein [Bryobacteraceae bacterium]|nr:pitrilysin family protein [Bryobacteraceae bacterium]